MKRFLIIFLGLLLPFGWTLLAQNTFATKKVFDGKVLDRGAVVETLIAGKQLASYNLSSFHSLKFTAGPGEAKIVEEMKKGASLREAQEILIDGGEKKNAVKQAALTLKKLFE